MALYFPGWADLAAVVITWGIGAALLLIGTALRPGRAAPEFRIVAGWGALCLVLTLWGVFLPWSLRIPAIAMLAGALAAHLWPGRAVPYGDWRTLGRMLLVTLPLWVVMSPVRPSQVDTFLNLLPNSDYLVDYARFPTAFLPPSYSLYPAAPYDTQFLAFLGSLIDPTYTAAGMSLVNVMLQLIAGLAIARMLMRGTAVETPPWCLLALGMLLVTLLDPGFVPRFHFSAYGETALAVTALLAACLFTEAQAVRAAGGRPAQQVELALILAAMINTKQSGIGLVLALAAGAAVLLGLAERAARRGRLLVDAVLVLLPAALLYGVWRYFAAHAGVDELVPLPLGQWNWAMLPATFHAIAGAIAEKPLFFVAVIAAFALFPVLLRRRGWSPAVRVLGFFAATFFLYNGFILVTYIAHFSAQMSAEAHSYFRYNTHLSLLLVLGLALAVRELCPVLGRPPVPRWAPIAAIGLALLAPIVLAERLRFDIEMPQPIVWDLAAALKPHLKDRDRLALVMPGDDGEIGQLLRDYLASAPPRRRGLDAIERKTADAATLDEVAQAGHDRAVISCTPGGLLGLPPGVAALAVHDSAGWRVDASWPLSPGIPLSHWQRTRHWAALCR